MKKTTGFILAFALLWCLLWGSFSVYLFVAGLALAALISYVFFHAYGSIPSLHLRWATLPKFAMYFLKILVQSNVQVARIVLRPGFRARPRIVRLNIADLTPAQATTLASVITLTPGTLSMDMSDDGQWLAVHCMSGEDREAIERGLVEVKQRLISEVFR